MNFNLNELKNFKKSINSLKREFLSIDDDNIEFKDKVKELINKLTKIYEEVFNDLSLVNYIKNYGDIYLPLYIKLLDNYNNLKKKKVITENAKELYQRIESLTITLIEHFSKKYDSLFDKSIVINDAEIKALLTSIK